jgi:hypothetical protein
MDPADSSQEKKGYTENQINQFLRTIGLGQPIDYIFLDYAMSQNRKIISQSKEPLVFMFHVIMGSENDEKPFPYCSFLELVNHKHIATIGEVAEEDFKSISRYVIYNFCPSETWASRPVSSFSDFHLYFLDVLKPMVNQSAEELYQIIDVKRGETFFLTFGDHISYPFISVLFITAKQIVVFHVKKPDLKKDDYSYICKWVSCDIPAISVHQHEYGIFELPEKNLVLTDKGVETRRKQWTEAFGDPDVMDMEEDGVKMSGIDDNYLKEDEPCLGCGA